MNLDGATVLVTGATSGIGRAVAAALAGRGARLLLTGRDRPRLEDVGRSTGGMTYAADLAVASEVLELADWSLTAGPPHVVVHNAGIGLAAAAAATTEADVQRVLAVNVEAPMALTRRLVPAMRDGETRLVFVTSIAGLLGVPHEAVYAASKAALHAYAQSLRLELAATGIGVTTFAPGVVDTEFFVRRGTPYDRRFPRPMTTERVAARIVTAVERNQDVVLLPRWLWLPVALHTLAPGVYTRLAGRWA
jgi:short-subunit dehydrogenase